MPRIRALSFGLVAILAGCSPAGGPATAPPATSSSAPATSAPAASATSAPTAPVVLTSAPAGLTGRLLYTRFVEATHTAAGMFASAADGSGEVAVPMPWTEGGGRWSTSGELIAIPTQLDDGRIGTAILDSTGAVLRVLVIADQASISRA
jgi:hypothetical protein